MRVQLDAGIRGGLSSVTRPHPTVTALLTSTESLPTYASDELIDTGSMPFFTMPGPVHIISLSAGALIRVYSSPSIAQVLTTTGRLVEGAERRIRDTGSWVSTVMLPGSLRPGGPGYVATLQVRMLHAHMRHLARTRDFDEAAHGTPINQVDLARTWMDFTVTMLDAEEEMGFGLTSVETARLYRYWWVLAHLLGIDPALVEGIQSNAQAHRVDELFQSVTGPLIPESSVLAEATLDAIADLLHEVLGVPESLGVTGLHSLTRRFHPASVADELGIRDSGVARAALTAGIGRVRARRAGLRADPQRWALEQRTQLAATRQQLAEGDPALYTQHRGD